MFEADLGIWLTETGEDIRHGNFASFVLCPQTAALCDTDYMACASPAPGPCAALRRHKLRISADSYGN